MLVFGKKHIHSLFLVFLKRTAFLVVLFLLLAPWQKVSAAGFEEICRGPGAGVCDSGLECDVDEDICLGSNGYLCQASVACANGLLCLDGKCAVDFGAGQGEKLGLGKSTNDIRDQIRTFINIFLGFLGVLGVLMVMYAGWLWMTARGNAEQVKKAKQTLTYAVLGILVILMSWTITSYILYLGQRGGAGGGGDRGGGGPPILPPEPPGPSSSSLEIEKFGTQHQDQDPQIDVYPSCGINIDFNLYVDPASVDKAKNVNLPSPLRVEKADMSDMAVRDFFTNANRVTYPPKKWIDSQGQSQTGDDLALSAKYQIVLPGILDTEEHPALKNNTLQYLLQNCLGDLQNVCNIIGNDIYWYFTTAETEEDLPKVFLASTAPADQTRNIPTYPVITLKFDGELFAPSFLEGAQFKDNIKIWQTNDGVCKIADAGCVAVNSPVSIAENWEAYLDGLNVSFYYRPSPRAELEPFSWYYFQADGILDLCGNNIIGNVKDQNTNELTNQIVIRFQVGEGAKFVVYPPNGADTLCTGNVPIYAQSTISLFDPINGQCGYNVNGSIKPTIGRDLTAQDPGPGGCTQYDFLPLAPLTEEETYQAQVGSDFFITETEKLKADWQFSTKTAAQCDNPPAITQLSPNSGSKGQCLGIIGYGFKGKTNFDGENQDKNLIHFVKKDLPNIFFDQTYDNILNSPEITGSWLDNNIVTIFPKDKDIFVKNDQIIISMQRYSKVVGKTLTTAENPIFTLSEEQIINKPLCLTAIELTNPQMLALAGEKIKLTGRNFSDENLTPDKNCDNKANCVKFNNDALLSPSYYWTDVSAESSIPGQAIAGGNLVFVHKIINPGAQDIKSNGYLFTVDLPSPDKPQIIYYSGCDNNRFQTPSPYPGRQDVCLIDYNKDKRIIFFLEYDRQIQVKAPLRFSVEDCGKETDPKCQGNFIPGASYQLDDGQVITNPDPNHEGLKITMTAGSLAANTWYQANMQSGVFDNIDPNVAADPFVWSFKTNEQICAIDNVSVNLDPKVINYYFGIPNTSDTTAITTTKTCQQLDANKLTWNWSIKDIIIEPADKQIASIDSNNHDAKNTATATGKKFGQTNIKAEEDSSKIIGSAVLTVNPEDYSLCDPHQPDKCLQVDKCPGSQCKIASDSKYHCTPVINSLSPQTGPTGTWLEITGCYFGEEKGATGKVNFNNEADGIFDKFPAQCQQSLWTNEKILTEVPAMAKSEKKPVKMITSLKLESNANQEFNLTADPLLPQLCAVNPNKGKAETVFTAIGKFNDKAIATAVLVGDKEGITDQDKISSIQIVSQIAKDAPKGEQVVKVIQDTKESPQEHIKFTVDSGDKPPGPAQTFIKILDYSPKEDNVCQNAEVTVKFDTAIAKIDDLIKIFPDSCSSTVTVSNTNFLSLINKWFKKIFRISAIEASGTCGSWEFVDNSNNKKIVLNKGKDVLKDQKYSIKIKGGAQGIQNAAGNIILNQINCEQGGGSWQENPDQFCLLPSDGFSGGNTICAADRVVINHGDAETFVYNVKYDVDNPQNSPVGSFASLTVTGYAGNTEINLVKPFYSKIDWQVIKKSDLIQLTDNNPAVDAEKIAHAVQKDKAIIQGSDVVKAVVTVGEKELTDTIIATLALCEGNSSQYFWKFDDPLNTEAYPDPPGNFSLSYCRYQTNNPASPLPLLDKEPTFPQPNQISKNAEMDILKEYYFRFAPDLEQGETETTFLQKPYAKDFFVLRIMPNWEQDYLSDWFNKEADNLTGINISSLKTKIKKQSAAAYAYEQADGGNILFVNALNLVKNDPNQNCDQTNCKMFTNVYILSYNQDAQEETKNIFNQLKTNWQFNTNFYNNSVFIIEGVTEEQIQRDWQRIRDLNVIAGTLEKYKAKNNNVHYPLDYSVDGESVISRVPGLAVSAWESEWQKVLTGKLKNFLPNGIAALPIDPLVNKVQCQGQDIPTDPAPKSPACSIEKPDSKIQDYYCRPAVDCVNHSIDTCPADYCQWIGDATTGNCQSTDKNSGTYVYQYQLTGDCYRYDESEVKCNLFGENNKIGNCKDSCVWHEPDVKEPKFRQEPGRCESACSSDDFTLKPYCSIWNITDQRCYNNAKNYDLYANFEYNPAPWCNAKKDKNHCGEYKFCQWQNADSKCLPRSTENNQPYCASDQKVFNVLYTSTLD